MYSWTIEPIELELKYTWKISRNASDRKTNVVVSVNHNGFTGKGEAAPNIRYRESADECIRQFGDFARLLTIDPANANELQEAIHAAGACHSLSFAIESAWFHLQAQLSGSTFFQLTGIDPPGEIATSYTIPIMDPALTKKFYEENRLARFPFIKLKVSRDDAYESLKQLLSFCKRPVMVDANESFTDVDECIRWMEKIEKLPLVFIEQPLPSSFTDESVYLKQYSSFPLFADESVTDKADFPVLKKSFDGVNMKLMKAGGYLNGISLLRGARHHGLKTMIGCMVETTLGISSGMRLCSLADYVDLDSFLLVKNEPFGLISEDKGVLQFMNA